MMSRAMRIGVLIAFAICSETTAWSDDPAKQKLVVVGGPKPTTFFQEPTKADLQLAKKLLELTQIEFSDTPLDGGLRFFSDLHGIKILVDQPALAAIGLPPDFPVTMSGNRIVLRTVLTQLLDPLGLIWYCADGAVKVTTVAGMGDLRLTRIYPVDDLIQAPDDFPPLLEHLRETVVVTGKPIDWGDDQHGTQMIALPQIGAICVRQSPAAHESIIDVLLAIRSDEAKPAKEPKPAQ